jgi:hypothetical protein
VAIIAAAAAAVVLAGGGRGQSSQGPPVPAEIRSAAAGGLKEFLNADAGKGLDRLGFAAGGSDVAGATVGDGFQVYKVDPNRLVNNANATTFDQVVDASNMWQLLVVNGTQPKSMITVDQMNGAPTAVSLGASGLADQLNALLVRWPAAIYTLRFIMSRQASSELVEVSQDGKVLGAVPLLSARVALRAGGNFDPNDLWPVERVIAQLRPIVKAAMVNNGAVKR